MLIKFEERNDLTSKIDLHIVYSCEAGSSHSFFHHENKLPEVPQEFSNEDINIEYAQKYKNSRHDNKIDLSCFSERELIWIVRNDEALMRRRFDFAFIDLLREIFIFTSKQLEVYERDLEFEVSFRKKASVISFFR